MSVYTTEVRYICEQEAGLTESTGYSNVEQVIANSWNKIFTPVWNTFDPTHKQELCTKILRHYYTFEIGVETVGLWKLNINAKLAEIMPMYNDLWRTAALLMDFNPLQDIDETVTHNNTGTSSHTEDRTLGENTERNISRDGETNTNSSGNGNTNTTQNGTEFFSDTPQGSLSQVVDGQYMTTATVNSSTGSSTSTDSSTGKTTTTDTSKDTYESSGTDNVSGSGNTTDKGTLQRTGKRSGVEYADALERYRRMILNIDEMIINDLRDQFMLVW